MLDLHALLPRLKGLVFFVGIPRTGKTSLMVALACATMGAWRGTDYPQCKRLVRKLNDGGYNLTVSKRHAVYADIPFVSRDVMSWRSAPYRIEIDELYLPEDPPYCSPSEYRRYNFDGSIPSALDQDAGAKSIFLPPYSSCFFDEAASYFDRGDTAKSYPVSFLRLLETRGHWGLNLYFTCHRKVSFPPFVRSLTNLVVEPCGVEVKHTVSGLTRTIWHVHLFADFEDYGTYLDTGKKSYEDVFLYVDYNVFDCYDSMAFFPLYLRGRDSADFSFLPRETVSYTADSVNNFNAVKPMPSRLDKNEKRRAF